MAKSSAEDMDVSENSGTVPPNHPLKNRVFHYKPSILGYLFFLETPSFWSAFLDIAEKNRVSGSCCVCKAIP